VAATAGRGSPHGNYIIWVATPIGDTLHVQRAPETHTITALGVTGAVPVYLVTAPGGGVGGSPVGLGAYGAGTAWR
jgi:hypothetical protein